MISIVCVYNDEKSLNRWLLRSLSTQDATHTVHLIDNRDGRYTSAAQALNEGAKDAQGDYILFAHQDVALCGVDWLSSVEKDLAKLQSLGIAGVAGMIGKGRAASNAEHSDPPIPAGTENIDGAVEALTLDECALLVPRQVFSEHRFEERICPDWHLYGVEFCLRIRKAGLRVYVLPQPIYHRTRDLASHISKGYFVTLRTLIPAYRRDHACINTTCGRWYTKLPVSVQESRIWRKGLSVMWAASHLMRNDKKAARITGHLTRTPVGQALVSNVLLPTNAKNMLDLARARHYEDVRKNLTPQSAFEKGVLTSTEINEHLVTLRLLTEQMNLRRVLELGVRSGQSTIALLEACKAIGGHVTSVDIEDCPDARNVVSTEGYDDMWHFVISDDLSLNWETPIDHLFIDTSHAYEQTWCELVKYEPFVEPGGVISLHDTISFPGVRRAVEEYIRGRRDLKWYNYAHNHGLGVIFKKGGT
jgi:predicted O-methyltransferase YrrM